MSSSGIVVPSIPVPTEASQLVGVAANPTSFGRGVREPDLIGLDQHKNTWGRREEGGKNEENTSKAKTNKKQTSIRLSAGLL